MPRGAPARGSAHRYGGGPRFTQRPRPPGAPGREVAYCDLVDQDWEERVTAAWAAIDDYAEDGAAEFRAVIDALADELPADSPLGLFERACAWDSTGHSDRAVPLYREALERGLGEVSHHKGRRAKIQLASSLRNTGHPEEGVLLLSPELVSTSDELDDAVRAMLALCLSAMGRDREGLSLVLGALAPHLPRYQRSMAAYARQLVEPEDPED
ncbi:tetratricopeptide repeat protein [Streptomyces olivaceus]|nr:tetratricopeptide repeat protein [Streptomyces olivaceus]MBZ6168281.1 tetratricopeptide repeat protein [Streptomyces olivaceus]MBZ6256106.1 tetratricopeptide repeat protein [Streptomyces olivaceus]